MTKHDTSTSPGAMPDEMAACAAQGELADEHAHLPRFVGTWNATVSLWFGPDAAEPHVSTGVMVNDLDLGGRYLTQTYTDDQGQFHGRGVLGYNTLDRRWEGFWIDDMSTFFQLERGTFDAASDTWTMIGEMTDPGSKQPMTKKTLVRMVSENEHIMETHFSSGGSPFFKGMEIVYTRA